LQPTKRVDSSCDISYADFVAAGNLAQPTAACADNPQVTSALQRGLSTILRGTRMTIESLIIWLIVGAIAGWLAGQVMKGGGFGLVGDIVLGIIGAVVAGWLLPAIGILIGGGILGSIINGFIGACIVLFVIRLINRA
jgi:uncharacterized membrane protein YeaQ/YmgE (transglycosylase-associated protein family)